MKAPANQTLGGWRIFRWPLALSLVNVIGLTAALVGDGWLDLVSWLALGVTLVVMAAAWCRGQKHK